MSKAYGQAGVHIESGYEAVERMKKHIARTNRSEVLSSIGGFGGLFSLANYRYDEPVLVSGTDGVGTKLLLAQQSGLFHTIGIDLVAMCANDVLAQGAQPLFFLDYLAVGHNDPATIETLIAGVAEGCVQAGAALIGGETAEMPDLYAKDEFDMAGFCVGIVDKTQLLDGSKVKAGDVLIGWPSSGIHSNGYSLVRKVFFKDHHWAFEKKLTDGRTLLDHLLTPTRIYVRQTAPLLQQKLINGIAHITGGGLIENVPRMYPQHLTAHIDITKWEPPLIFQTLAQLGQLPVVELYTVFNMGIGMVLAASPQNAEMILDQVKDALRIGHMTDNTTGKAIVLEGLTE